VRVIVIEVAVRVRLVVVLVRMSDPVKVLVNVFVMSWRGALWCGCLLLDPLSTHPLQPTRKSCQDVDLRSYVRLATTAASNSS
jgi:hypothetical protein